MTIPNNKLGTAAKAYRQYYNADRDFRAVITNDGVKLAGDVPPQDDLENALKKYESDNIDIVISVYTTKAIKAVIGDVSEFKIEQRKAKAELARAWAKDNTIDVSDFDEELEATGLTIEELVELILKNERKYKSLLRIVGGLAVKAKKIMLSNPSFDLQAFYDEKVAKYRERFLP